MKALIIGSGGREHALAWALGRSKSISKLYCAPGNPGMESVAELVSLKAADYAGLIQFATRERIDLTVVGPEQPLAEGVVDLFQTRGLPVFGPTQKAAELEWSKAFAKSFMRRHGIPTAAHETFGSDRLHEARAYLRRCPLPVVLKADGLAAGKGVLICRTREEALSGLHEMMEARTFGNAGLTVVVEEMLFGEEASVFAVSDGEGYVVLPSAQDHKRVFDHDKGKNTGGMGAYAPTPRVTPSVMKTVEDAIIRPTLRGMAEEGRPYRGCLYVGLMLTEAGPKVIEFNSRFGDPETQVVLPLYGGDVAELLWTASTGSLGNVRAVAAEGSAVCVVLASGGYPDSYQTGFRIDGLESLEGLAGVVAFHAGTRRSGDALVTAGGRVLGITAVVECGTLRQAVERAYDAVSRVTFSGMHYRRDIGRRGIPE